MREVYVFDLDGTLVDSMSRFAWGTLSILDEEGIPYDDQLIKIVTPLGYTKTAEYYVGMGVQDTVEHIVSRIEKKLVHEYSNNIVLKEGVGEYLRRIHAEGARLFVLTASPHIVTDVCLKRNGVYDLFEKVWSVEDFGLSKSDTRIFFEVAKTVGCEPGDIHYFDDNLIAVKNSKAAGLKVYGCYDAHDDHDLAILKDSCDVYVRSFADLL
ncbi:MAG: HAD family phosphatase [Oscillospiraceae bacterium]|nr:HAD family phosphatase [Oscillospiraceae bacterium]